VGSYEKDTEPSGSIKSLKCIGHLIGHQFIKTFLHAVTSVGCLQRLSQMQRLYSVYSDEQTIKVTGKYCRGSKRSPFKILSWPTPLRNDKTTKLSEYAVPPVIPRPEYQARYC
jgi:hypothetical protein